MLNSVETKPPWLTDHVTARLLLLSSSWDPLGMPYSVDEEHTVAQTTSTFQRLDHMNGNTWIINFVGINLENNDEFQLKIYLSGPPYMDANVFSI